MRENRENEKCRVQPSKDAASFEMRARRGDRPTKTPDQPLLEANMFHGLLSVEWDNVKPANVCDCNLHQPLRRYVAAREDANA